jgi:hypothetical protein
MVYFSKPKIPDWVYFGGPLNRKCWYILWSFGIFYNHFVSFMVYFVVIRLNFPRFGMLYRVKSGNPVSEQISKIRGPYTVSMPLHQWPTSKDNFARDCCTVATKSSLTKTVLQNTHVGSFNDNLEPVLRLL